MSTDSTEMTASKFLEHLSSLDSNQKSMLTGELIIYLTNAIQREADLEVELATAEDKLHKISQWCRAYPLGIFTEPDWNVVREKLGATLLTQVSGSNMRHIVNSISEIIGQEILDQVEA